MPRTSEMRDSKFMKQDEVGERGAKFTITGVAPHNVAKQGAEEENKWCLEFAESDKPLVLNQTNIQLCERIFGSDDTDQWIGKQLVAYADPTIQFQGKIVGGIRVRAVRQSAAAAAARPAARPAAPAPMTAAEVEAELTDDDIPF